MNNLDYIAENRLTRYPFKDNAPLEWISADLELTTAELPNDLFLDAKVIIYNQKYLQFGLRSIVYHVTGTGNSAHDSVDVIFSGIEGATSNLTFTFRYTQLTETIRSAIDNIDIALPTIEFDYSRCISYFVDILGIDPDLAKDYTLTFDEYSNVLCASTLTYAAPLVDLKYTNLDNDGATSVISHVTANINKLLAGTNIVLNGSTDLSISVIPGAGQGLYDACTELGNVIRRINNLTSDSNQNYTLTPDECYNLIAGSNSLAFNNSCKPACTEDELKAFAHYLNRIKDGVLILSQRLSTAKTLYDNLVAKYITAIEDNKKHQPVFMQVDAQHGYNKVKDFNTITCGIYSPNKDPLYPVFFETSYDPAVFTYVEDTSYVMQDGKRISLKQPGFGESPQRLNCNGIIYTGFVLSSNRPTKDLGLLNFGEPKYDVKVGFVVKDETGVHRGYGLIPLLCASPNISVVYNVFYDPDANKSYYKFIIHPFYKESTNGPVSLKVDCPPQLLFKRGTLTTKGDSTPITNRLGFQNITLDLNTSVICTMEYECPNNSTFDSQAVFVLSTTLGSSSKVLPLNKPV